MNVRTFFCYTLPSFTLTLFHRCYFYSKYILIWKKTLANFEKSHAYKIRKAKNSKVGRLKALVNAHLVTLKPNDIYFVCKPRNIGLVYWCWKIGICPNPESWFDKYQYLIKSLDIYCSKWGRPQALTCSKSMVFATVSGSPSLSCDCNLTSDCDRLLTDSCSRSVCKQQTQRNRPHVISIWKGYPDKSHCQINIRKQTEEYKEV